MEMQFHCEMCGISGDADDVVIRHDNEGLPWELCPECGKDYDTVILQEEGLMWVVKTTNYDEIARFHRRSDARRKAEALAFTVQMIPHQNTTAEADTSE